MIARQDAFPVISLSPQLILDCDQSNNYGCMGGDALGVMHYFHKYGAVDDSCSPYLALSWYTSGRECNEYSYCSYSTTSSDSSMDEYIYSNYPRFYVDEFGWTQDGEEAMLKLLQEGPIVCSMAVDDDFYDNYDGGIYYDKTGYMETDHEVAVVGYGVDEETGEKFWIVANSWGTSWGDNGYFRIVRGVNNLAIEEYCVWATIQQDSITEFDDRWTDLNTQSVTNDNIYTGSLGGGLLAMRSQQLLNDDGVTTSPLPSSYLHSISFPESFGWQDYYGKNLLNIVKQSNAPYRCDASWAFAVTEIISDRLNIMNYLSGISAPLQVNLSPQVLINLEAGGNCDGGYAGDAMKYLYSHGVPDETCQNYMAINDPHGDNSEFNICYTCDTNFVDPLADCYSVEPDEIYKVMEYGYLGGVDNMKAEIYARGPIACSLYIDQEFQNYDGGIFGLNREENDDEDKPSPDYIISIVGFGYDETLDKEYWIGKNQWGIAWGIDGYIKILMGENINGIENHCIWGVPEFDDELQILTRRMNDLTASTGTEKKDYSFLSWISKRLGAMSLV